MNLDEALGTGYISMGKPPVMAGSVVARWTFNQVKVDSERV